MRRWLVGWLFIILAVVLSVFSGRAQQNITLEFLAIDLLPEYDDPGMLVIEKFRLPPGNNFPLAMKFHVSAIAHVSAVAYERGGKLYYVPSAALDIEDGLQVISLLVEEPLEYRIEYYLPLERIGQRREFTYQWLSGYSARRIAVALKLPEDSTKVSTDPPLAGQIPVLRGEFDQWQEGSPFTLNIAYQRAADFVQTYQQPIEPAQPLEENIRWSERMLLFWPWLLGSLGLALITGGGLYYWFSGRGKKPTSRKQPISAKTSLHCHQCGQRARPGDKFCRLCGTRLRQDG